VNKIWWASVVLPAPGAPAITVKEYSGSPPPSTSSRPGTPVGSRVMATRDVALMLSLSFMLAPHPDLVAGDLRPGLADQAERQILADERDQQPNDVGEDGGEASLGRGRIATACQRERADAVQATLHPCVDAKGSYRNKVVKCIHIP